MKKNLAFIVLVLLLITPSQADDNVEVYLLNQLDDPRGFCIDVRGHKYKAQVNKGLQAHTCYSYQGKISSDQGFNSLKLTKNQFILPSFNVCMEASSLTPSTLKSPQPALAGIWTPNGSEITRSSIQAWASPLPVGETSKVRTAPSPDSITSPVKLNSRTVEPFVDN